MPHFHRNAATFVCEEITRWRLVDQTIHGEDLLAESS